MYGRLCYQLFQVYASGEAGIKVDEDCALIYLQKAINAGDPDALSFKKKMEDAAAGNEEED